MAPTFDTILDQILTDYSNLDPAPDTSIGSPAYIMAAVLAAAIWGLYKYQDNAISQAFPNTASGTFLDNWGGIFGIARLPGELDIDYSKRITFNLSQPPAGGTKQDYINWALTSVPANSPIPANIDENFLPSKVYIGQSTPTEIAASITLDGTTNFYGWVNGDPITLSSTGSLPSPLLPSVTYYAFFSSSTIVSLFYDQAFSLPVVLDDQGTGVHTISHAPQSPTDPNSFFISNAFLSTPNDTVSPSTPGSVSVWLSPNTETILDPTNIFYPATWALTQTASNYIDTRRPLTANRNTVNMETLDYYSLQITISPVTSDITQMVGDIENYMAGLNTNQKLYGAQLIGICLRDGADTATITYAAGPDGTFAAGLLDATYVTPPVGHAIRLTSLSATPVTI